MCSLWTIFIMTLINKMKCLLILSSFKLISIQMWRNLPGVATTMSGAVPDITLNCCSIDSPPSIAAEDKPVNFPNSRKNLNVWNKKARNYDCRVFKHLFLKPAILNTSKWVCTNCKSQVLESRCSNKRILECPNSIAPFRKFWYRFTIVLSSSSAYRSPLLDKGKAFHNDWSLAARIYQLLATFTRSQVRLVKCPATLRL